MAPVVRGPSDQGSPSTLRHGACRFPVPQLRKGGDELPRFYDLQSRTILLASGAPWLSHSVYRALRLSFFHAACRGVMG